MSNKNNLKPFTSDQSHEEAVKNGRKGGVASGIARRKKADLKAAIETALTTNVVKEGVEMTGEAAIVSALMAIASDPKNRAAVSAFNLIAKITGQDSPVPEDDNDMVREFLMAMREQDSQ